MYDEYQNIHYIGSWIKGLKEGLGISYAEDEKGDIYKIYDGQFKNNLRHGYGKLFLPNQNLVYCGFFEANKKEGRGIEYYRNGKMKYFGVWRNDKIWKLGREFYNNGVVYCNGFDGDRFHEGMKNGDATILNKNGGVLYKGRFVDDEPNGFGVIYFENGYKKYQGV